ncbi:MAG TPA: hypothetical protein VKJ65_03770 [Phycisphaerae bacterium]|nr:hypothetical protein [Phycisphaerae bacterium]
MTTKNPDYLVDVPKSLLPFVGEPDPGTRIYRTEGDAAEGAEWFNRLVRAYEESLVSPGGVSLFAPVSRPAVHKAMKEGRLTAFLFHEIKMRRSLFGTKRARRKTPFVYIPVIECKGWARQLLAEHPSERELYGDNPDWGGSDVIDGPKEFRRRPPKVPTPQKSQKKSE